MSIEKSGIATGAYAVTPHDTNEQRAAGLYVGGTGNVRVVTADGDTVTFTSVPAGRDLPIRVTKILSTGTTATNITGYR